MTVETPQQTDGAVVTKTDEKPKRKRRSKRRGTTVEMVGALVTAFGAIVIARAAFGIEGIFINVIIGYLVFIATVAVVEVVGGPDSTDEIDLREPAAATDPLMGDTSSVMVDPIVLQVVPDAGPGADEPLQFKNFTKADMAEVLVAFVVSIAFAELLRITLRIDSWVGLTIWWYLGFAFFYFLLVRDRDTAESALDKVVTVVVWTIGVAVAALLLWIIVYVFAKGWPTLKATFFTEDMSKVGPLTPGGGAKHAIIGTLEQVGIATIVVVPVGILTAVYLHEIHGKIAGPVRFIVDAMSGLPSIVAGLFIYAAWITRFGYSGIGGAMALSVLMLPTMTRATEEILRTVPNTLREGALALGAPQWRLVQKVVLPTAMAGIVTAALLAIARAIGETAPLLFTAFGADRVNTDPFHNPQSALPLFVWKLIFLPNDTAHDRAFAAATVLILIVFVLFVSARVVSNRGTRKLEGKR